MLKLLLSIALLTSFLFAAEERPLPQAQVLDSVALPSAESAVGGMWVSQGHDYTTPDQRQFPASTDLIALEEKAVRDFTACKGEFASIRGPKARKRIVLIRYTVSDPRVVKALIDAKAAGIGKIHLVLDLNEYLQGQFAEGQEESTDFAAAKYKSGSMGTRLKELVDAGFRYNDPTYGIFSQPLFAGADGDDERHPLMHQKELFLAIEQPQAKAWVRSFYGTANLSESPRFNRIYREVDLEASRYGLEHADLMMKTFSGQEQQGKTNIKDIASKAPLKIQYTKDGSFQELAYTDGKFNWNRRVSDLLVQAANAPNSFQVQEIVFSHFVFTFGDTVEALRKLMGVHEQPRFPVFGVFDDKFIEPHGFGQAGALSGFWINRHFGRAIPGFWEGYSRRMNLFGYQRLVPGAVETSVFGPPISRHLWHDKTTLVRAKVDGQEWNYLFTGSFNHSNNKANAEKQVLYKLKGGSKLALAVRDSVVGIGTREPQYALPLEKAIFRNILSQMLSHSLFEISPEKIDEMLKQVSEGKTDELDKELRAIASAPTTLSHKPDEKVVGERIRGLVDFIKWYPTLPAEIRNGNSLSVQGMSAVIMAVTFLKDPAFNVWRELESVFWKPVAQDQRGRFEALLKETTTKAWQDILRLQQPIPPQIGAPQTSGGEKEPRQSFWRFPTESAAA